MRHIVRIAVLACLLATPLTAALSQDASANLNGDYIANGVNIRTGPGTSYTSLGLGYVGQGACTFFSADGETINGNNQWYYHTNETTTVTGYSHSSFIAFDSPSQNC